MKKIIITICALLGITLVGYGVHLDHQVEDTRDIEVGTISIDGVSYEEKAYTETYLLLGIDDVEEAKDSVTWTNQSQSDFIALLQIDKKAENINILYINRDTMVDLRETDENGLTGKTVTSQLAMAHCYGYTGKQRCTNSRRAVSELLYGIDIDHYVSLNMSAMGTVNDLVDGVTLTFTEDLTDIDPAFTAGSTVTLQGEQAERFVRARRDVQDGTNLGRMDRQSMFITAFIEAFRAKQFTDVELMDCFKQLDKQIVTDCSTEQLSSLFDYLIEYDEINHYQLEGSAKSDQQFVEFYPDQASIDDICKTLYLVEYKH